MKRALINFLTALSTMPHLLFKLINSSNGTIFTREYVYSQLDSFVPFFGSAYSLWKYILQLTAFINVDVIDKFNDSL
jgi:hypothetical protein